MLQLQGKRLRLTDALSFGTASYPPKVARRLRVLNFACWAAALAWLSWTFQYFPDPGLRVVAWIDLAMAAILAALPLLHRYGPYAAALAFVSLSYPATFVVCWLLGTDTGIQMHYLAYAAGAVLIWGTRPLLPLLLVVVASVGCIVALEFLAPRDGGRLSEAAMQGGFVGAVAVATFIVCAVVFYAVREMNRAESLAEYEFGRAQTLLANILPDSVAERLKSQPDRIIADRYDEASILFADMAGFTAAADSTAPADLVEFLNGVFTAFDRLAERHGLEKIKTTGDSYMIVSGVPIARADHAAALLRLGTEMLDVAASMRDPKAHGVQLRIGIASGPVVAGIVGVRKFFYDVWGDAVNVASRMESTGLPGRIQVSPRTYELVKDEFEFEPRGPLEIKGKGLMTTWLLKQGAPLDRSPGSDAGASALPEAGILPTTPSR